MNATSTPTGAVLTRAVGLALLMLASWQTIGHAQIVVANFTAAPTNGCGSLTVNFFDLSSGPVTAWAWDVNNDGVVDYTTQNPTVTFGPGTYSVSLTVSTLFGLVQSTMTMPNLIRVNAIPVVDAGGARNVCSGSSVVIGGVPTASGGSGGYTYAWSPAAGLSATNVANPVATPASTTTYAVTVTDAAGCSATGSTTVNVRPLPGANAGPDVRTCDGSGVQIGGAPTAGGGTGPYSYSWSPGTGLSSASVSNPIASPGVTTSYTVTVTDAFGCSGTDNVTVTVNNGPTASAGPDRAVCTAGSVVIGGAPTASGGTGPYTYTWSPAAGLSSVNAANPVASPGVSTNYTVIVTDANGCSASDVVQVVVTPRPTASAGPGRTICPGGSVAIGGAPTASGGSGPYFYAWTPGAGLSSTTSSNPTASPTTTTTYTVTVTDINGCSASDNVTVTVPNMLLANAGVDRTMCRGTNTILGGFPTAMGGTTPYTYAWSPSTGLNSSTIPNPTAAPLVSTIYTVTITDANGCSASDVVNVIVNLTPSANAGLDQSICRGGSAVLGSSPTATGGTAPYSYAWTPSTGLSSAIAPNPTANPLTTTVYDVTVTDANGCTSTDAVTVNVSPLMTVYAGPDAQICRGSGWVLGGTPTVIGGTPPYSIAWSPATGLNATTIPNPTAAPFATTVYTVTVTDAFGCMTSDAMTLLVNPAPIADAGPDALLCRGGSTMLGGSPTAQGGTPPYSYLWTPSSGLSATTTSNPTAAPTATTKYILALTDANGCTAYDSAVVTVFPKPTADAGPDITICSGSGGTGLGGAPTARGGTAPYSYAWSPAAGLSSPSAANPIANPAVATTYMLIATDANGCSDTDVVEVTVNASPTADAGADLTLCSGASGTIGGAPTASGGTGPYTYLWSPTRGLNSRTAANPVATPPATTAYRVVVTDANGCSDTAGVLITVTPKPVVDAGSDAAICLGGSWRLGGSPTASSGTPPYRYAWSPAATLSAANVANPTATPSVTTQYTVVVTDAGGCIDSGVVTVGVTNVLADAGRDTAVCLGSTVRIGGAPTASGGRAPYRYQWSPAAGLSSTTAANPIASPRANTVYTVTVTDAGGCTRISAPVMVSVHPVPAPSIAGVDTVCQGSLEQYLTANVPGNTYSWTAIGGTIQGPSDRSTAVVRWGAPGTASLVLTESTPDSCSTRVVMGVLIHALPAKPAITSLVDADGTETLRASAAARYQWYVDGEEIPGATAQVHVPARLGIYTVMISDTNICPTASDPMPVTAEATVTFPSITDAKPDELVRIPLILLSSRNMRISGATKYDATIRFNPNLLHPLDEALWKVTGGAAAPPSGTIFIHDGERPAAMEHGTLRELRFSTMLGDSECTQIDVEGITWLDRFGRPMDTTMRTQVVPGRFCTITCNAGGKRLITSAKRLSLMQNRPNPFNPTTEIEYEITEPGRTVLSVHDLLGRRVAVLVDGDVDPGRYSVTFKAGELASGIYLYTLQTPTRRLSRMLHVEK